MEQNFEKYHGIGNDFLVVSAEKAGIFAVPRAVELCDRHFGVGADGVLVVSPPRSEGALATMSVINADGSQPEMCGNGLRCVALHLFRTQAQGASSFVVDTDAGALRCDITGDHHSAVVGTEIGQGTILEKLTHAFGDETYEFMRVSTGNPHAITFCPPIEGTLLDQLGPEVSGRIKGGANVEIATLHSPRLIELSVWERGVGRTLACGTGAAATVIAAVHSGRSPFNAPIVVELPGGPLEITVSKDLNAHLRGPAQWVYSGKMRAGST